MATFSGIFPDGLFASGGGGGGGGAVDSVFGRTGVVSASAGDYTGSLITNVPSGNIAATDVQAAINELDNEKVSDDLFDANTILKADVDDTPLALTVAASTIVGRAAAGNISALTSTQATAILDAMVGDSGAGGTKGLVPTPSIGDATRFLGGDATWKSPASNFDATVGATGANYTTVALAYAAGARSIVIISDATETTDIITTSNLSITVSFGTNWDVADNRIRCLTSLTELSISTFGDVQWSPTTSKNFIDTDLQAFDGDIVSGSPIIQNISIDAVANLYVGQTIRNGDFPQDTNILSIDSTSQITVANNATNTVVGAAFNQGANAFVNDVDAAFPAGLTFDMSGGSSDDCYIYENLGFVIISGVCAISVPNQDNICFSDIGANIEFKKAVIAFLSLSGGTPSNVYKSTGGVDELVLVGTFHASNQIIDVANADIGSLKLLDIAGAQTINMTISGSIGSFTQTSGTSSLNLIVDGDSTTIKDCAMGGGSLDIQDNSDCYVENCKSTGILDLTDASASSNKFYSCSFDSAMTIGGNDNKIIGGVYVGGITDNGLRNEILGSTTTASTKPVIEGIGVAEMDSLTLNNSLTVGSSIPFSDSSGTLTLQNVDALDASTEATIENAVVPGLDAKQSVRAATNGALPAVTYDNGTSGVGATLTADSNGALPAQDGITLIDNDRLLVKDQAAGLQNGIYDVTDVGDGSNPFVLTRSTDADDEINAGMYTFVEEGSTCQSCGFVLNTVNPIVVGTTSLTFNTFSISQLDVTDSNFIVGNGSSWVVESGSTARTSLGLGSMATQDSSNVNITGGTADFSSASDAITVEGDITVSTFRTTITGSSNIISFERTSAGQIGRINKPNSTDDISYLGSSDYRLKNSIETMSSQDAINRVMAARPVTYNWNSGGKGRGFIAHELAEAGFDHAVDGEKDAVNKDGSIKPQAIDPRKMLGEVVRVIQYLVEQNKDLISRVEKLEILNRGK